MTGDALLPVLWLYGPGGVGKTTIGWELFTRLTREGTHTGYVDIDQLGMCYAAPTPDNWAPEPASDPGRYHMKAKNLDAVVANFRDAGARCLVVSGVVDPLRGFDPGSVPHAALTMCRLRADPAELRRRIATRGRPTDDIDLALSEAEASDRNDFPGVCVDTTGRSVAEVVELVRQHVMRAPVLWLCGPRAVGKSSVGWHVYRQVRGAGRQAAFIDLDQIGFHRPAPAAGPADHRLRAANLASIWRNYRAAGAQCLVVVGPLDDPDALSIYTDALPPAGLTLCLLHAGHDQLTERVMLRGQGLSPTWGLAGDDLAGQPEARLRQIADEAWAQAQSLEAAGVGDLRVDTDGRRPQDIAHDILRRTGWPAV